MAAQLEHFEEIFNHLPPTEMVELLNMVGGKLTYIKLDENDEEEMPIWEIKNHIFRGISIEYNDKIEVRHSGCNVRIADVYHGDNSFEAYSSLIALTKKSPFPVKLNAYKKPNSDHKLKIVRNITKWLSEYLQERGLECEETICKICSDDLTIVKTNIKVGHKYYTLSAYVNAKTATKPNDQHWNLFSWKNDVDDYIRLKGPEPIFFDYDNFKNTPQYQLINASKHTLDEIIKILFKQQQLLQNL